jgi:microcystin-dependent protein
MGTPYLSELRIMSFNFAPQGWAECNGQFLPINQNQALFALLGTTYGGNGQTTFALPNLRGRTPIHFGSSFTLGESGGEDAHTLTSNELPTHNHFAVGDDTTTGSVNATFPNARLSNSTPANVYGPFSNPIAMEPTMVGNTGGSQAHTNQMPYLKLTFCIALQGIFPSRN